MNDYDDCGMPDPSTHTACEHPESCIQCNWRQFACNLVPLCRFHHRLKHTDGWSVELGPDLTVTWTTPTRRRYKDPPPTIWD